MRMSLAVDEEHILGHMHVALHGNTFWGICMWRYLENHVLGHMHVSLHV